MQGPIARRGLMLVLSSPSGAGKSTLSRRLLNSDPMIAMSVSVTTRAKRPNEVEGKDYHFVTRERFEEMVKESAFLEHATVFKYRYGTPKAAVENMLAEGRDPSTIRNARWRTRWTRSRHPSCLAAQPR